MTEFKFPCPNCKQPIQCDAGNVGAQINCPACKQAIIVPPAASAAAASGERTVQFKVSTLRTAGLIGLGVLLAAGAAVLAMHLFAGPKLVKFKAYVDGTDVVHISGSRLWIEHLDFSPPTSMRVNAKNWHPTWNDNISAPCELSRAFRPDSAASLKLTKQLGRGNVSIVEEPSAANKETLSIKLDDGGYGGADWYEFTVSW